MSPIEPTTITTANETTSTLYYGWDCRDVLRTLPDKSIHMVATSPPYWGLRDYQNEPSVWGGDPTCNHDWNNIGPDRGVKSAYCSKCKAWRGQLGLEPTPYEFVDHLVEVFREVKRVLRDDGTLWLNLGDSYANPGIQGSALSSTGGFTGARLRDGKKGTMNSVLRAIPEGVKYKDLVGVPWRVALALQADGWYLRSDIIWSKPNCMPESVTDRPTKAHEYVFLLTKSERYFYDADAIREPHSLESAARVGRTHHTENHKWANGPGGRNKRSVWPVALQPYAGAHFATWPEALVRDMILAGTAAPGVCPSCLSPYSRLVETSGGRDWRKDTMIKKGIPGELAGDGALKRGQSKTPLNNTKLHTTKGWEPQCACPQANPPCPAIVLDPFSGSATTGKVANDHGRNFIGIDQSRDYFDLARNRLLGLKAPPIDVEPDDSAGSILDLFGN